MNPEAERLTGWGAAEAMARPLTEVVHVVHEDTGLSADDPGTMVLRTGQQRGLSNHTVLISRDGRRTPIESKASPIRYAGGPVEGVVLLFRDCTRIRQIEEAMRERTLLQAERDELEAEVHQAQKMESVGLLAGGVAHDFNNALTLIMGSTEVLAEEIRPGTEAAATLDDIRRATARGASLTRQLLAFSRKDVIAPRVVDFNALVSETERMLRRLLGEDIELTALLDPAIAHVRVDPGQWDQVLMNLAVNARDAMTGCGRLTIRTRDLWIDAGSADPVRGIQTGRYVEVSIEDTGCGMPQDVMSRIFEPFFTTKGVGHGTGLGLAVVYGIVRQSGGHIDVRSEINVGTTFTILIPTIDAAVDCATECCSSSQTQGQTGSETILLVEDEESLRRMAARVLTKHGYTVLQAASGLDALRMLEQHPGEIHLLVTDVVMPGMDGRELAGKVRDRRPDIRMLFTSGYTEDAILHRGIEAARVAFLQKPYSPATLAGTIRKVLNSKVPASV